MPPKAYRKKSLLVEIKEEDLAYALKQNRYNCAIVRAIQRAMPEALHVRADTEQIAFSLPSDDTRYYFETPREVVNNVIEPFDKGKPLTERTFILQHAIAAEPIRHGTREELDGQRNRDRRTQPRAPRARTKSGAVHTVNRFLDFEAQEGEQEL